jgi:molybdopterin-guanine dinucleotide biosynthesis protein MobB
MNRHEPPVVSIVGRKNSGKTTLTVAVAAELRARGMRIGSVKHGHHQMELDEPGRDSWRHFHEGGAEAVLLVGADRIGWVERSPDAARDPGSLIRRFFGDLGLDLVLVEGFKHGPFAKIEIFRRAVHESPIHDPVRPDPRLGLIALVTDDERLPCTVRKIMLDPVGIAHVGAVADLVTEFARRDETG